MKTLFAYLSILFGVIPSLSFAKRNVSFSISNTGFIKIAILNVGKISQTTRLSIDAGQGGELSEGQDSPTPLNSSNYFGVATTFKLTHLETAAGYRLIEPEKGITVALRVRGPATLKIEVDESAGALLARGFIRPRHGLGGLTSALYEEAFSINHDHPF